MSQEPQSGEPDRPKKARERPAMQIYRPPGLRTPGTAADAPSPTKPARSPSFRTDNDRCSSASSESHSSSTKSERDRPRKQHKPAAVPPAEPKKRQFAAKEFDDIVNALQGLELSEERHLVEDFIETSMKSDQLAEALGLLLTKHAIEEKPKQSQRTVARLSAALMDCPSGAAFQRGLLAALHQYFECREQLRQTHMKVWTAFMGFLSDVYAHVGFSYEGGLVELLFRTFHFLLEPAVLHSLTIEELESLISSLLSVGYDLERNCPDQLGSLRDGIRDAFVLSAEPWARKMILLLMELSASGWSLPAEANEYYFQ